jgi:hypothetical protein
VCTKLPIHAPRAGRILHGSVAERVASAAYFEERDALSQWASERLKHGPDLQEKRTDRPIQRLRVMGEDSIVGRSRGVRSVTNPRPHIGSLGTFRVRTGKRKGQITVRALRDDAAWSQKQPGAVTNTHAHA